MEKINYTSSQTTEKLTYKSLRVKKASLKRAYEWLAWYALLGKRLQKVLEKYSSDRQKQEEISGLAHKLYNSVLLKKDISRDELYFKKQISDPLIRDYLFILEGYEETR